MIKLLFDYIFPALPLASWYGINMFDDVVRDTQGRRERGAWVLWSEIEKRLQ